VPRNAGFLESARVSVSVSSRRKSGSYRSVSASKNSVPDSDVRDRFDDWVGGWQFGPFQPHHPVLSNRRFPGRVKMGCFCGQFRRYCSPLSVSGDRCGLSGRFLASCLCIQKFRSPRRGCDWPIPLGSPGILGAFWGQNGPFCARSILIAGSIRGHRTAGSILLEHHEVARLQYRVANDLRLRPARDLARETRVRSSC
jgi:hypothetical protein